jgi:hypothetical protein
MLLRIRNILDKSFRENLNKFLINTDFYFENCAVYEIMAKNMVEREGLQMTSQYGVYDLHAE